MATNETIQERIAKDKEVVLDALNKSSGIVASACKAAGISRFTFYKWLKEDSDFAEKVEDIKELQKDFAEALILKKMKEGDTTMIIFYAKTQMKDRGYTERKEITGKDGEDLIRSKEIDIAKLTPEQREVLLSIGLDIINTLCKFYGVCAPIFIDNRESVNDIIETESQIINLVVNKDNFLTIK